MQQSTTLAGWHYCNNITQAPTSSGHMLIPPPPGLQTTRPAHIHILKVVYETLSRIRSSTPPHSGACRQAFLANHATIHHIGLIALMQQHHTGPKLILYTHRVHHFRIHYNIDPSVRSHQFSILTAEQSSTGLCDAYAFNHATQSLSQLILSGSSPLGPHIHGSHSPAATIQAISGHSSTTSWCHHPCQHS